MATNGKIMKRSEISDKDLAPNIENQKIMKNLGIPGILIQILKISLSEGQKSNEDYQDLIRSIYLCLIRFCTDNQEHQNMVGEHLDFLLKELDFCPLVVFLIKEIFKNNKGFIASKRTSVVQYIAQKEAKLSIDSAQKQYYLMILKTLSRNQNKSLNKTPNEILDITNSVDDSTIQCFFETKEEMEKAKNLVKGFKNDITELSMSAKEKAESTSEHSIPKSQILFGNFKIVLDYLEKSDFFLPFKKSIVEYVYHMIKANQRDIYGSESCEELLWRIITNLVQDCEQKAEADDLYDEVKSYGYPLNETHKSISDKYIFKNIYIVISTIIKMKLDFDERSEIVKRIVAVTSQLYFKMEKTSDMTKWVIDLFVTMRDNSNLSPYLAGIKTPFDAGEDPDLVILDGERTNRAMRKGTRRNTLFNVGFGGETKASMFYTRVTSLVKSEDMKDLLNKEFEKLVDWFSKFSEK